jgi:predicted phosphodiesterase
MSIERFAVVTCSHAPLHDEEAHAWAAQQIREIKPTVVVHIGDLLEAQAASRFNNESSWSLRDEYEAGDDILHELREASPRARHIFLPGNHDFNIRAQARIPSAIRSLVDYRLHIPELANGKWEQPVETYTYDYNRGVFRLGQIVMGHGWAAGMAADKQQTLDLAIPYGLGIFGHTHRPKPVTQVMLNQLTPLPYWFANPGTLREIVHSVEWMNRNRKHQWGQGLVTGEVKLYDDDNKIPSAPEWEAETRIFRMFNDIE